MYIPEKAKVAVLKDIKTIQFIEHPLPNIMDDEILIRIEGGGVCGTDVHEYRNDPFGIMPIALGHEGTGEIVKLGRNIASEMHRKPSRTWQQSYH